MRLLGLLAFLVAPLAASAQDGLAVACNPACANQPTACCAVPGADQFLAEQCTGATSQFVHFVVPGTGTGWADRRLPAQFTVSGLHGTSTLGDAMPTTFSFVIGNSSASARFQVLDTALNLVGQCVGVSGNTYSGLPSMISLQGRALQVLKTNPLFCRSTVSPAAFPDLLCLTVKGQVGPPFVAQELCDPDRVEYACGTVH